MLPSATARSRADSRRAPRRRPRDRGPRSALETTPEGAERDVALERIRADQRSNARVRERFEREARRLACPYPASSRSPSPRPTTACALLLPRYDRSLRVGRRPHEVTHVASALARALHQRGVATSESPRWDPCSVAVRAHADEGAYRALIDASVEQHEVEDALEDDQSARSLAHALLVEHVESSFAVEDDPPSWQLCTVEVEAATFRRRNEHGFDELRALPGAVVDELPEENDDDET